MERDAADQLLTDMGIDAIGADQDVEFIRISVAKMANCLVTSILYRSDVVVELDVLYSDSIAQHTRQFRAKSPAGAP